MDGASGNGRPVQDDSADVTDRASNANHLVRTVSKALLTPRDQLELGQQGRSKARPAIPSPQGSAVAAKKAPESLSPVQLLLSGAAAGSLGKTVTAPVDRVKILYQVAAGRSFTLARGVQTARDIVIQQGTTALWRGNGAAMYRVIPYSGIAFSCFDQYHTLFLTRWARAGADSGTREKDAFSRFSAGAAAGATATALTYPFDLLRARMAAHWGSEPRYPSYGAAILEIMRTEGAAALFSGLKPTLLGIIPYAGLSFGLFEQMKAEMRNFREGMPAGTGAEDTKEAGKLPVLWSLAAGAFSGLVAQTVAYPFHVVRRRMQVGDIVAASWPTRGSIPVAPASAGLRDGVFASILHIAKHEGVFGGLFRGVTLTWIKAPFAMAITFTANDFFKNKIGGWNDVTTERSRRSLATRKSGVTVPGFGRHGELVADHVSGAANADGSSKEDSTSALGKLVAGGVAGAVSKTVIAPADRVKILYQVNPNRVFSLRSALASVIAIKDHTGVRGLWRGHGAQMLRVVPYAATGYVSFDYYQHVLLQHTERQDTLTRLCAGAAAGATAVTLTYPLDLLRARMAAHWSSEPLFPSYLTAVRHIAATGGISSLYHGIRPTLLGIMPYAGLNFAAFETLKERVAWAHGLQDEREVPTAWRLVCGGVAGLFAQSSTYPLDIVRRRMQVGTVGNSRGVCQALVTIAREEGIRKGLYKGLSMNWLKGPIAVSISFTVNDVLKHRWLADR